MKEMREKNRVAPAHMYSGFCSKIMLRVRERRCNLVRDDRKVLAKAFSGSERGEA